MLCLRLFKSRSINLRLVQSTKGIDNICKNTISFKKVYQYCPPRKYNISLKISNQAIDVHSWRVQNEINVNDPNCPAPWIYPEETTFPGHALDKLNSMGYINPTALQAQAWPAILTGKDIYLVSEEKPGNIISFILPSLKLWSSKTQTHDNPQVLILVPTARHGLSVLQELNRFTFGFDIRIESLDDFKVQETKDLQSSLFPHYIIATPKRLKAYYMKGLVNLRDIEQVILHRVELMWDHQDGQNIKDILSQTGRSNQVIAYSTSYRKRVEEFVMSLLASPIHIKEGTDVASDCAKVSQRIFFCDEADKVSISRELLEEMVEARKKVVIFVRSKRGCDYLRGKLRMGTYDYVYYLEEIDNHSVPVAEWLDESEKLFMIATTDMYRELDLQGISHLLFYDMPSVDVYSKIIGRFGISVSYGKTGVLFTSDDEPKSEELVIVLRESDQPVPQKLEHSAKYQLPPPSADIVISPTRYKVMGDLPSKSQSKRYRGHFHIPLKRHFPTNSKVKKLCPFPIRSQKSKPRHIKELRELADRNAHPEDFEDEEEESVLVSEPYNHPVVKSQLGQFIVKEITGLNVLTEKDLNEMLLALQSMRGGAIIQEDLKAELNDLNSPDGICCFFQQFHDIFKISDHIQEDSTFGVFIREMLFAYENLFFDGLSKLYNDIQMYKEGMNIGEVVSSVDVDHFLEREIELIQNMIGKFSRSYIESYIGRIKAMIPETPKVFYLQYLNAVGHGDFPEAVDLLYRYFDYYIFLKVKRLMLRDEYMALEEESDQKRLDQEVFRLLPFAPLLLSSLHITFGHIDDAVRLIQESVRLIQRSKDDKSLTYAIALMSKISESQHKFHEQLHFFHVNLNKALDLNIKESQSYGSFEMAGYHLIHPFRSSDLEESLSNNHTSIDAVSIWSYIDSGIRSIIAGDNQTNLVKSSVTSLLTRFDAWKAMGNKVLANLMAHPLSKFNQEHENIYCPILCNLALQLSSESKFEEAANVLLFTKENYLQTPAKSDWAITVRKVLHEWATLCHHFEIAEIQIHKLTLISSNLSISQFFDSLVRHTEFLIRKGSYENASNLIGFIVDGCNNTGLHYQTIRHLLLWAEIHIQAGSYISSIPYILSCITMSKRYNQELYTKLAKLKLADVYLKLNSENFNINVESLLKEVTPYILENGTPGIKALLKLVLLKLCISKYPDATNSHSLFANLSECESYVLKSLDHQMMTEFYYTKARLMDTLGEKSKRNEAARRFKQLTKAKKPQIVKNTMNHFYITPESLEFLVKTH